MAAQHVPVPQDLAARAFQNYPHLVIKAIKGRCKAAEAARRVET
jgi:hypothetical protein